MKQQELQTLPRRPHEEPQSFGSESDDWEA